MKVQVLTGINTSDKSIKLHAENKVTYSLAREAFKKLVQYNWYYLGTILFTIWAVDKDKARKAANVQKWQNAWYNLGGNDFWVLYDKAEKAYNKKAVLFPAPPSAIRTVMDRLVSKWTGRTLNGFAYKKPIGAAGAAAATTAAVPVAVQIIAALSGLVMAATQLVGTLKGGATAGNGLPGFDDGTTSANSSGFGWFGLAAGAALFGLAFIKPEKSTKRKK